MKPTSLAFKDQAKEAIDDPVLQRALLSMRAGFQNRRAKTISELPEFDALRDRGRDIKNHTLAHLDRYLERFETQVKNSGGHVHWAPTAADACDIVSRICRDTDGRVVTKGKSMVAEEIGLNDRLEADGLTVVETDLGEYIIQLRREPPSHIIAPALHLTKEQIADSFREHHTDLDPDRVLTEARALTDEARAMLRDRFLAADVGITGANFLIAETGSTVIVTNEGNGDLTQNLPRVHIVVTSIEKVVPTLEDASTILRLLARSATGQEYSTYTTFSTGPRRPEDPDGPEEFHVVLVDNGRSSLLGTEAEEVLRCIRCGACINHCPVYASIGGHAYGWVVPGPVGAALDPGLIGLQQAHHLPKASSFCGRCEEVCPMRIPLPKIMRHWREQAFEEKLDPPMSRWALGLWGWLARRPALYRAGTGLAARLLRWRGGRQGRMTALPFAGGWTKHRDLPAPEGRTFQAIWAEKRRKA